MVNSVVVIAFLICSFTCLGVYVRTPLLVIIYANGLLLLIWWFV